MTGTEIRALREWQPDEESMRRLRQIRERARISQWEVACHFRVSVTAFCLWENGYRTPPADVVDRYRAALIIISTERHRELLAAACVE